MFARPQDSEVTKFVTPGLSPNLKQFNELERFGSRLPRKGGEERVHESRRE